MIHNQHDSDIHQNESFGLNPTSPRKHFSRRRLDLPFPLRTAHFLSIKEIKEKSNSCKELRGYNKEFLEGGHCFKRALIDEKRALYRRLGAAPPDLPPIHLQYNLKYYS